MARVRTGKSKNRNAYEAGREAASQVWDQDARPGLVLVYGTAGYDQQALLNGITAITGSVPLSGCSTSGVITREGSDESSHAVGLLALAGDGVQFKTFQVDGFSSDAAECGKKLADQIRESDTPDARLLLIFPDGLTGNVAQLLESLESHLPSSVAIAGGTSGELLKLERTWQYHNGKVNTDSVSAVLVSGNVRAEIAVSHGCEPIGLEQTVTRAEGGWIYEIDGQPAWSVYREYLDPKDQDIESFSMAHVCYICLAESLPEEDPNYGKYLIRCPLQLDRKTGGLFFPGDIAAGTKVRMALRNPECTIARAKASAERIRNLHPENQPTVLLHFDCCCRASLLFGRCTTEMMVQPLQKTFGENVPWFGFNTYGEIAAIKPGKVLFHNYSVVLCALYLEQPPKSGSTHPGTHVQLKTDQ